VQSGAQVGFAAVRRVGIAVFEAAPAADWFTHTLLAPGRAVFVGARDRALSTARQRVDCARFAAVLTVSIAVAVVVRAGEHTRARTAVGGAVVVCADRRTLLP